MASKGRIQCVSFLYRFNRRTEQWLVLYLYEMLSVFDTCINLHFQIKIKNFDEVDALCFSKFCLFKKNCVLDGSIL